MEENLQSDAQFTDWKDRKSFSEEWQMVQDIFEGRADNVVMETYLRPLVPLVVDVYAKMHPDRDIPKDIFKSAFKYLTKAIKSYYGVKKDKGVGYKFSTYFEWYMRQGLLESSVRKG